MAWAPGKRDALAGIVIGAATNAAGLFFLPMGIYKKSFLCRLHTIFLFNPGRHPPGLPARP